MTERPLHEEIPVKVTAWIERGIAPLVEALNEFRDVVTVASCEGHDGDGAYVLFRFRGDGQQAARFASDVGEALAKESLAFLLQAEWRPGEGEPLLALSCPRESVSGLATALSACRTRL